MDSRRRMDAAGREYARLISLLTEELWDDGDRAVLEYQFERPITVGEGQSFYVAAHAIFEELIVAAIAEALDAGVTQRALVDNRGWLSHNDIRGYIERARKPRYDERPELSWIQAQAFWAARRDYKALLRTNPNQAASFCRATRSFFKRWALQIPTEPSAEYLARFAVQWRPAHVEAWVRSRKNLLDEIEALGRSKDQV